MRSLCSSSWEQRRKMCYVGRGTEQKHSSETLGITFFEFPEARAGFWSLLFPDSALFTAFWNPCMTKTSHPELLFKHKGILWLSPDSSCTNTIHSPNHSWSLPWFPAPSASWWVNSCRDNWLNLHTPVCVWPAGTVTEQLCLHSLGSQLCPELLKHTGFCLEFKEKKKNYWIRAVLNVFEGQIRAQRRKGTTHTFIDCHRTSWVERYL